MAIIYPFKGLRFNKTIVEDFSRVFTQPYDKTTPSMLDDYYQRSPYNVARITLNLEKREDPETSYSDAGAAFTRWINDCVLLQDPIPSIYAYYQEYSFEGQRKVQKGFIALLDLKNCQSGIIPHERTLDAPKQDRLRLMRSLEGNEDSIYMLYSDEKLSINKVMDDSIQGRQPDIEATDEYNALHRIWGISDAAALAQIQDAMRSQNLFIADGHHRFETSIEYMRECERKGWTPGGMESFDKRIATCFNSADGVTILPTHRLIRDLPTFDAQAFLHNISPLFDVEQASSGPALWATMKNEQDRRVFGFYPAGLKTFYLLRLKSQAKEFALLSEREKVFLDLDVSILHKHILERFLGIDEKKLEAQAHVDYERERQMCVQLVDKGKYQAAFFVNPTSAEQMQRIASLGERMPQKSTDFFPKLLTGLVFMKMEIKK